MTQAIGIQRQRLGEQQREVLRLVLAGHEIAGVASQIGTSVKRIEEWLEMGRRGVPEYVEFSRLFELAKLRDRNEIIARVAAIAGGGHEVTTRKLKKKMQMVPVWIAETNYGQGLERGQPIPFPFDHKDPPGVRNVHWRYEHRMMPAEEIETTTTVPPDGRLLTWLIDYADRVASGAAGKGRVIDLDPEDIEEMDAADAGEALHKLLRG